MFETYSQRIIARMLVQIGRDLDARGLAKFNQIEIALKDDCDWSVHLTLGHLLNEFEGFSSTVRETLKILDMWRALNQAMSYLDLGETDRLLLAARLDAAPEFAGFNAAHDQHFEIWHRLTQLGRYPEFGDYDPNSNFSEATTHLRLLKRVRRLNAPPTGRLSSNELAFIFREQK